MSNESTWWNSHSPKLVQQEIINDETSSNISTYFKNLKNRTPVELILISCGIFATLCISGGIISIFAHNWDDYSKPIRVMLSMIPIICGLAVFGKALFQHLGSKVWMECASVFLVLMTGSTIALISQVYNLGGSFERFLLIWMLTAIPIVYLANSSLSAILYAVGITVWAYLKFVNTWSFWGVQMKDPDLLYYWVLFAALIPHFLQNVSTGIYSLRSNILGWCLGIAILFGASVAFLQHQAISMTVVSVLIYALGKHYYKGGAYFWHRPFQTLAIGYMLTMGIMLTFEFYLRTVLQYNHYMENPYRYSFFSASETQAPIGYSSMVAMFNYLLLLGLIAVTAFTLLKNYQRTKEINWAIACYPIAIAFGLFIAFKNVSTPNMQYATWWFNAYMLFIGGYYLYKGITMKINGVISMGIFMLALILAMRYFDSDISFLSKGMLYLLIGSGFLCFNYFFDKKIDAEEKLNAHNADLKD